MELKCSECGGKIQILDTPQGKVYQCLSCGKQKIIKETKTIDMSDDQEILYG